MVNFKKLALITVFMTMFGLNADANVAARELAKSFYSTVVNYNPTIQNLLGKIATQERSQRIEQHWQKVTTGGSLLTVAGIRGLFKSKYRIRRGLIPTVFGATITGLTPLVAYENQIKNGGWLSLLSSLCR